MVFSKGINDIICKMCEKQGSPKLKQATDTFQVLHGASGRWENHLMKSNTTFIGHVFVTFALKMVLVVIVAS